MKHSERGSAAIELLILAPIAVALIVVVVAAGRYVDGQGQTTDTAFAAARAASLVSDWDRATAAGREAAAAAIGERGLACAHLEVSFVGSKFEPGGRVIARVTCSVDVSDAGALGDRLGLHAKSYTARAVVPIDTHREDG